MQATNASITGSTKSKSTKYRPNGCAFGNYGYFVFTVTIRMLNTNTNLKITNCRVKCKRLTPPEYLRMKATNVTDDNNGFKQFSEKMSSIDVISVTNTTDNTDNRNFTEVENLHELNESSSNSYSGKNSDSYYVTEEPISSTYLSEIQTVNYLMDRLMK